MPSLLRYTAFCGAASERRLKTCEASRYCLRTMNRSPSCSSVSSGRTVMTEGSTAGGICGVDCCRGTRGKDGMALETPGLSVKFCAEEVTVKLRRSTPAGKTTESRPMENLFQSGFGLA